MRISWRELDWISEGDRDEIEKRAQLLGGNFGLDRVDFTGRAEGTSGAFEIRITANAAKRQIIAVRRDSQRVKAFNSAFEALERSVASALKGRPAQQRSGRATSASTARARPALAVPAAASRLGSWIAGSAARAALAGAGAVAGLALVPLWMQGGARDVEGAMRPEPAAFSAVAELPGSLRSDEVEPAFSAVAQLARAGR